MLVFLMLNVNGLSQNEMNGFVAKVVDLTHDLTDEYSTYGYTITITGGLTIFKDSMDSIKSDITSKDLLMLPFIFAFMIYVV